MTVLETHAYGSCGYKPYKILLLNTFHVHKLVHIHILNIGHFQIFSPELQ